MKARIDAVGADFVVLLGDNFYPNGVGSVSDPQWQSAYEQVYGGWHLPVYAVLGNHDYGGHGAGTDPTRAAVEVAYTALSTTWKMPAQVYRLDAGPARLVFLDTNNLKMTEADTLGQGLALGSWLAGAPGWKIVVGHHPYRSNGPHGNAGTWDGLADDPPTSGNGVWFRSFFQGAVAGRADLYLAGHDHSLQVLDTPGASGPLLAVVGGGGQTLTGLPGTNPTRFQASSLGFAEVAYDEHRLTLTLFNEAGQSLYQTRLTR